MKSDQTHHYNTTINWTGNKGLGTTQYEEYGKDNRISADIVVAG